MKIKLKPKTDKILAMGLAIAIPVGIFIVVSPVARHLYSSGQAENIIHAYMLGMFLEIGFAILAVTAIVTIVVTVKVYLCICEGIIKSRRKK